ncbi:hypothetical protein [Deinococcus misasensis]|uniref:hypothetical protein n=1 Tax=Deinococcus misasensis TaxID=392413 RepID=UPI0005526429|nr:hypothetical protein [Deinococcus misasensis]
MEFGIWILLLMVLVFFIGLMLVSTPARLYRRGSRDGDGWFDSGGTDFGGSDSGGCDGGGGDGGGCGGGGE